jgi:hypothetical protein
VTTITALLTNKACGYPTRGARRRRKPMILACLHQTANAEATAIQERNYANRTGSWGPSATAYIDRNGTVVRAIDPVQYAAWSQGDVAHTNTKLPTIAAAVASGVARADLLHAIYDRIVVKGRSIVAARLTPAAYSNGLALALPQVAMARPEGFGRAGTTRMTPAGRDPARRVHQVVTGPSGDARPAPELRRHAARGNGVQLPGTNTKPVNVVWKVIESCSMWSRICTPSSVPWPLQTSSPRQPGGKPPT